MRKVLALALVMLLAFAACAETAVPFAGKGVDMQAVEMQTGAVYRADGGYSAVSYEANALIRLFYEKIPTYAGGGMIYAYASLEGNRDTGVCYPCLNVLYAGPTALNAEYVMFAFDNVRYDVRVSSSVSQNGRYKVETMKAFLTSEGLEMLEKLNGAEKADVTVLGSDQYRQLLDTKASYANQKNELGGKSLSALALPIGAPDFSGYRLTDLALEAFENAYGIETVYSVCDLSVKSAIEGDRVFGLIADGASAVSIRAMQELLVKKGFMAGAVTSTVTHGMISSVKSAQAFFALPETGYADAKLISLLSADEMVYKPSSDEKAEIGKLIGNDNISMNISSWWTAARVETTVSGGGVSVSDKNNVFIAADGYVKSNALKNLSLSWEVTAEMVLDGKWSFPANLYVETQAGEALSANLGMLYEGRLIVTCEVPLNAADSGEWVLMIHEGADTFEFALER